MKRASVFVALLWLLQPAVPAAAVPTGMNPYIYGMHDNPGSLLDGSNSCGRGWVTELRYIGTDGTCGGGILDYSAMANNGLGIIMRLDVNGTNQLPTNPADYDGFANSFAACVAGSTGIRVWIVGNEPNIPWGSYVFSPAEYGEIYSRVRQAVKALPNGAEHEVLFAAPAIWAAVAPWGDWDDGLGGALDYVLAAGGTVDGASIHAYSREHSVGSITSDDWFPGRENKWHLHFRIYRDFLREYAARGLVNMPLYITEAGSVCDPPCDPYQDQDLGYFEAMYEEVHNWNQAHPDQIIRAVTPYRWTSNDDGSGRDFCIGCSAPLVQDMNDAIALGRKWHQSGCHEPFGQTADGGVDAEAPDAAGTTDGGGDLPDAADIDGATPAPDADPGDGNGVATGCGCSSGRSAGSVATAFWILLLGLWGAWRRLEPRQRPVRNAD